MRHDPQNTTTHQTSDNTDTPQKVVKIEQKMGFNKNAPVPSKSHHNFRKAFIWRIETDILWG